MGYRMTVKRLRTMMGQDEWGDPIEVVDTKTFVVSEDDFQPYDRGDSGLQVGETGSLVNVFRRLFVFNTNVDIKIGDDIEYDGETFGVIDVRKFPRSHFEVILRGDG